MDEALAWAEEQDAAARAQQEARRKKHEKAQKKRQRQKQQKAKQKLSSAVYSPAISDSDSDDPAVPLGTDERELLAETDAAEHAWQGALELEEQPQPEPATVVLAAKPDTKVLPAPIADAEEWAKRSAVWSVPLLGGVSARALAFAFAASATKGEPSQLHILGAPGHLDAEQKNLVVTLSARDGADVAIGTVVVYDKSNAAVVELPPDLPVPKISTLAALCSAMDQALEFRPSDAAPTAVRPNSAALRRLTSADTSGLGAELASVRAAARGDTFIAALSFPECARALRSAGMHAVNTAGDEQTLDHTTLLANRELPALIDVPGVRLSLLVAATVASRCEVLRLDLGAAAELPPPLEPSTAVLSPQLALTELLAQLRGSSQENGVQSLMRFLSEQLVFVQNKLAEGAQPTRAQIGQLFQRMGARIKDALPASHPDVASSLAQAFSIVGWDVWSNSSTATDPPALATTAMVLQTAIMSLQHHMAMHPPAVEQSDDHHRPLAQYHPGLLTHAIIVDLIGGRRAELGEVVCRRLIHCATLSGFCIPADARVDEIMLHSNTSAGIAIHWRTPPQDKDLAATCIEKLRAQLPLAIGNFDSIGFILSPSSSLEAAHAQSARVATSVPIICWHELPTQIQVPHQPQPQPWADTAPTMEQSLQESSDWGAITKRASTLRHALKTFAKSLKSGPVTSIQVLPSESSVPEGLGGGWYRAITASEPLCSLLNTVASFEAGDLATAAWTYDSLSSSIQQTIRNTDIGPGLAGTGIMDGPVQSGSWLITCQSAAELSGYNCCPPTPSAVVCQPVHYEEDLLVVQDPNPEPLLSSTLEALPVEQQMQLLGERLYARILPSAPTLGQKVTGMLMEMGSESILELLSPDSDKLFRQTVAEAVQVLEGADMICNAVKSVWASAWEVDAIKARTRAGFDHRGLSLPVICQRAPHCPPEGRAPAHSALPTLHGVAYTGPNAQLRPGGGTAVLIRIRPPAPPDTIDKGLELTYGMVQSEELLYVHAAQGSQSVVEELDVRSVERLVDDDLAVAIASMTLAAHNALVNKHHSAATVSSATTAITAEHCSDDQVQADANKASRAAKLSSNSGPTGVTVSWLLYSGGKLVITSGGAVR